MAHTYKTVLIGCGRMGATIDDEVANRPDSFIWQPFSHAAAAVACERTNLIAVSDVFEEKAEAIRNGRLQDAQHLDSSFLFDFQYLHYLNFWTNSSLMRGLLHISLRHYHTRN